MSKKKPAESHKLITVTGPLPAADMGFTLPHEHIMVDFIGAAQTGKYRYDSRHVIKRMLPFLQEIYDLGVRTFIDCTPQYLGRDTEVLQELSLASGVHIITNTGLYKDKYLPDYAYEQSAQELAEQWIKEATEGIDGTGIKPGFIKTAVSPGTLTDIEKKLIAAAALTSNATSLTIATHTCSSTAAADIVTILEKHNTPLNRWIFVHAHMEEDVESLVRLAHLGVWIELDGLAFNADDNHSKKLHHLLDKGLEQQILLSHDGGWYNIGEENGGKIIPYTHMCKTFLPRLRREGVSDDILRIITMDNPARAFAV
jgi:predicted metal-dependent phosphotriesterase family hydrolase